MKTRMTITLFLGLFVVLFFGISLAVVRAYSLPSPEWVSVGPAADYPRGDAPYALRIDGAPLIYIVNINDDLFALSAKDPHPLGQVINWRPQENRFIDPLTGSNYWLDGSFDTRFLPDGPEPMDMVRYPVKVDAGILWVDIAGIGD